LKDLSSVVTSVEIGSGTGLTSILTVFLPGVVPISQRMSSKDAEYLNKRVCEEVLSRLRLFGCILDAVVRQGEMEHWAYLDMNLAALSVLLKESGLNGALSSVESPTCRVAAVATRDDIGD